MKHFHTHDLGVATVLLHEKCIFLGMKRGIDPARPDRSEFVFEDTDELRKIVDSYLCGTLMCPAHSLLSELRRAKHILYDYPSL